MEQAHHKVGATPGSLSWTCLRAAWSRFNTRPWLDSVSGNGPRMLLVHRGVMMLVERLKLSSHGGQLCCRCAVRVLQLLIVLMADEARHESHADDESEATVDCATGPTTDQSVNKGAVGRLVAGVGMPSVPSCLRRGMDESRAAQRFRSARTRTGRLFPGESEAANPPSNRSGTGWLGRHAVAYRRTGQPRRGTPGVVDMLYRGLAGYLRGKLHPPEEQSVRVGTLVAGEAERQLESSLLLRLVAQQRQTPSVSSPDPRCRSV